MNQYYFTYVLLSQRDHKFYIGWTTDLQHRLYKHNNGEVMATVNRRPLELVYYEACLNKDLAIAREKYFKTGFGRRYISARIKSPA